MRKKLFLLGVGCQKGGTSWLHSQLNACKNIDFGFDKEYHVFDSLYIPECSNFKTIKLDRINSIQNTAYRKDIDTLKKAYSDPESYFEYFNDLYTKSNEVHIVGDITPSYCALPSRIFQYIKDKLNNMGFTVKVIFIMRDPVYRIFSHVKMIQRNRLDTAPEGIFHLSEIDALKRLYNNEQIEIRTRYEKTITELENVFPQHDLFYALHENMFNIEFVSRLKLFLEQPNLTMDHTKKTNTSNTPSNIIPDYLSHMIYEYYLSTYEYCKERFQTQIYWKTEKPR